MKLGLDNGVANLFDKMQVKGKPGDLIRNGTYLEMLPTPVHNFKATTEWITDEIFHRYHPPKPITTPAKKNHTAAWIGGTIAAVVLITGSIVGWRIIQPSPQQQPIPEQNTNE